MTIVTKLSESDIIRFNFYVFYRKWFIRIITAVMILDILLSLLFPKVVKASFPDSLLFPVIFLLLLPLMIYVQAKRNFKNNRRVSEQIEYVFEDKNLIIAGESFNSTMTWDKILKVTKTKRWLLVWQTKNMANLIPLKDIWDGDILNLKEILGKRGVSNNL
jgi:hypothetical protein